MSYRFEPVQPNTEPNDTNPMNKWLNDEFLKSKYNPVWVSGSFGKVSYLNKLSGNVVSINFMRTKNNLYELPLEPSILWTLRNSEHIIRIVEYYVCYDGYALVFEYFSDTNLDEYIFKFGALSDQNCRYIMSQLKNLIDYLRIFKIFNPDFCCKNLKVDTKTLIIKMHKFKHATSWHDNLYSYLIPECINPPESYLFEYYKVESFTSWQLGYILFHLVTGNEVFRTQKEIIYNKVQFSNPNISLIIRDLIEHSLYKTPELRMKLQHFFGHVWFNVG